MKEKCMVRSKNKISPQAAIKLWWEQCESLQVEGIEHYVLHLSDFKSNEEMLLKFWEGVAQVAERFHEMKTIYIHNMNFDLHVANATYINCLN
jgi:hypothetical protein